MKKYLSLTAVALAAAVSLCYQSRALAVEKYGEAPDDAAQKISIGSILSDPKTYLEKEVVVEGKVVGQCPSGCFFIMNDDTGQIYVELKGSSFSPLRQCSGSTVAVKGTVYQSTGESREIQLLAKGLVIKSGKARKKGVKTVQCGNS